MLLGGSSQSQGEAGHPQVRFYSIPETTTSVSPCRGDSQGAKAVFVSTPNVK